MHRRKTALAPRLRTRSVFLRESREARQSREREGAVRRAFAEKLSADVRSLAGTFSFTAAVLAILTIACGAVRSESAATRWTKAGEEAMDWAQRVVALGPRPPGSEAHQKLQKLIVDSLKPLADEIQNDNFEPVTPVGKVPMTNLIAKFSGQSGKVVVVSGHYDTYSREGLNFVGANDGGSSTAFLLAFAKQLKEHPHKDDIWLVFFDGEESFVSWQDDDHTYGSRQLARKWKSGGTAAKIKAVINVDMIGDADLSLVYDEQSTRWLRDMIWETAHRLGYGDHFPLGDPSYIEDDHMSFINAGYAAVDLIDLRYGLLNRYWHTENDTIDKLSAGSFSVVMHVVWESLNELAKRP